MLTEVAEGVWVHTSAFMQSNAVIVRGPDGALVIDPGVTNTELVCLSGDLRRLGLTVAIGFTTHPHWDHLLWHPDLGDVDRYGTARCAATARAQLAGSTAETYIKTRLIPPDIADQVPLDLLGRITALPQETDHLEWNGPRIRIIEHQAHAAGHAALLIEGSRVLVAGDMLSDILTPMLNFDSAGDPIQSYQVGLTLLEEAAPEAELLIPGHGGICLAADIPARFAQDRIYVNSPHEPGTRDPRLAAGAYGADFLPDVHHHQVQLLAQRR